MGQLVMAQCECGLRAIVRVGSGMKDRTSGAHRYAAQNARVSAQFPIARAVLKVHLGNRSSLVALLGVTGPADFRHPRPGR